MGYPGQPGRMEAFLDRAFVSKASFQEQLLDTASFHDLIFSKSHSVRLVSKTLMSIGASDSGCQDGLVKLVQSNSTLCYSIAF